MNPGKAFVAFVAFLTGKQESKTPASLLCFNLQVAQVRTYSKINPTNICIYTVLLYCIWVHSVYKMHPSQPACLVWATGPTNPLIRRGPHTSTLSHANTSPPRSEAGTQRACKRVAICVRWKLQSVEGISYNLCMTEDAIS